MCPLFVGFSGFNALLCYPSMPGSISQHPKIAMPSLLCALPGLESASKTLAQNGPLDLARAISTIYSKR
jgi:hypothetical protein